MNARIRPELVSGVVGVVAGLALAVLPGSGAHAAAVAGPRGHYLAATRCRWASTDRA